jgi:transposase-like protein
MMEASKPLDLFTLMSEYGTEEKARGYLERLRWPDGPICPHCGAEGAYRLTARPESKSPARPGLWKCKVCRKQFTVKLGTIFEDSHIPLSKWVIAIHLLCASKKGMSAHQLHRMLGVSYKTAWFMAHRLRWAMAQPPLSTKLAGIVEADETYIGGYKRGSGRGRGSKNKQIVVALVERGGRTRAVHVERVTSRNLKRVLAEHVDPTARLMTDSFSSYHGADQMFSSHETVNHVKGEYARGDVHVNNAESYFGLLKRGIYGTYHHVSKRHLHRYLAEFDFCWNERHVFDGTRAGLAAQGAEGKRLTFRPLRGSAS